MKRFSILTNKTSIIILNTLLDKDDWVFVRDIRAGVTDRYVQYILRILAKEDLIERKLPYRGRPSAVKAKPMESYQRESLREMRSLIKRF